MLKTRLVSSLEKAFLDESIDKFKALDRISAFPGELVSFQLLYRYEDDGDGLFLKRLKITLDGELASYAKLRRVRHVPVTMASRHHIKDTQLLRTAPGLYPDLLEPIGYGGEIRPCCGSLESLWITLVLPDDCRNLSGCSSLSLKVTCPALHNVTVASEEISLEIIDAALPKQELIYTQWFHTDCLAHYYNVPMWSERHWEIIESFARVAAKNGINMLLTPVFTPPLDTEKGGERLTAQLVAVKKSGSTYEFDFNLLDRWIAMCDRVGIEYLEISHLFTQAGAKAAPKVMATVDGEYKRIFGWETVSCSPEYSSFLAAFTEALTEHMKKRGDDRRCYFHISDEPHVDDLDTYSRATACVSDKLRDYRIMDAMSDFKFYEQGILKTPVVYIGRIKPFLDAGVKGLWAYYAGQTDKLSGNLLAHPSCRTRSLGMQLYKYNIEGFLHWGYNFYNNCDSVNPVNPYVETSGEGWVPAGDTFSVYPARDGDCLESIRIAVFKEGIDDIRAMRLCERYYSHEAVVAAIEEVLGEELTFERCALSADEMLAVRERINGMIKTAICK